MYKDGLKDISEKASDCSEILDCKPGGFYLFFGVGIFNIAGRNTKYCRINRQSLYAKRKDFYEKTDGGQNNGIFIGGFRRNYRVFRSDEYSGQ